MNHLEAVERASMREDVPEFRSGDTVRVNVRVVEGGRERVQSFEGIVIARNGKGVSATFTVRKVSYGVGVDATPPGDRECHLVTCTDRAVTLEQAIDGLEADNPFVWLNSGLE